MIARLKGFKLTAFHFWAAFLLILIAAGVAAGLQVFLKGLVVTNLTDIVPWGLWITIDLSSIALSAGAFLLCAGVYLVGLKEYQGVARTATFIGLIGYSMAVLCLMLDIGRPDRFWHALVYWNTHSLLWEVTMCVTLYFTVLVFEVAPIIGESGWFSSRWPKLGARLAKVHHFAPYLAILGLGFSMLHQSSLGATYGVLKARPLWYRPDLSVLFMASAIAGGPSLTVFVSMLAGLISKRVKVNDHLLERVSYFIGWVLVGYLYFRFWDALSQTYTYQPGRTEGLRFLTKGPLAFNFWAIEMGLGTFIPMVLLLKKSTRENPWIRTLATGMVVLGLVAYRWDLNISGQLVMLSYLPQEMITRYTTYFPSVIEILTGAGIVAYGMLAVSLGVRYLDVVDHTKAEAHAEAHEPEAEYAPAD